MLVVGVNSDASVKRLKGELRPVCDETHRARVVAGLRSVDHVFVFGEQNNHENIRLLRPDVYLKAGDYTKDTLTSTPLVEAYGGEVVIVPFASGYSSTAIIDRIAAHHDATAQMAGPPADPESRPAIFLDRDGTICEHVEYLHEPEKFVLLPHAIEGLRRLREAGYRLVVVTNQPGIGMGYFTKEDFFRVNKEMLRQLSAGGVMMDRIYYSPYGKAEGASCRKPGTGMIDRARVDLNVDVPRSWVIGDMTSDVQLARNAGCSAVLVRTGQGGGDDLHEVTPDLVASDLLDAAEQILAV